MKKNKKTVSINEEALVELIYDITERTIAERIEKGELLKSSKPVGKTKKITVTESQLKALKAKGVNLISVKKKS